jgi:MFS transporter, PHS family, inorganic phosphate transporter
VQVYKHAAAAALVTLMGTVPGCIFCIIFIASMGRKMVQILGFAMMTVCLITLSTTYDKLRTHAIWAFVFVYAMGFFFANFGPNTTTFITPGECFPSRFKGTCFGLSAASGQAGAIVGLYVFGNIAKEDGYPVALGALACFMFAGLVCSVLMPEQREGGGLKESPAGESCVAVAGGADDSVATTTVAHVGDAAA